jgi:hypothetical protein
MTREEMLAGYYERLSHTHLTDKEFDELVRRIRILENLTPQK